MLVKKFLKPFYGTWRFNKVFIKGSQRNLFSKRQIQTTPSHHFTPKSILIQCFHLRLRLPSQLLPHLNCAYISHLPYVCYKSLPHLSQPHAFLKFSINLRNETLQSNKQTKDAMKQHKDMTKERRMNVRKRQFRYRHFDSFTLLEFQLFLAIKLTQL